MAEKSLEEFVEAVNGASHLRVEHDFGDGFVRLRTSEAERRQAAQDIRNTESVVLELLRNARDAHASHVFLAVSRDGSKRLITVIDDGEGIPASMHGHVFEPRVTSKLDTHHMDAWGMHGRGMALYSIKVNAKEAYIAQSAPGLGCAVHVETDTTQLGERADQSSFPTFEASEDGVVNVRGPRNILRVACEFAVEARNACSVFVGSPVDIAATVYEYGMATTSPVDRAFCRDRSGVPIVKRLATTGDSESFAEVAASMGLAVSERSARRILDGQIAEAESLVDRIVIQGPGALQATSKKKARRASSAKMAISSADKAAFARAVKEGYIGLAQKYYLDEGVEPDVRISHGKIVASIPVVPLE